MNGASDLIARDCFDGDENHRCDERDAGSIDLQAWNAPQRHSDVGQRKHDNGKGCHRPAPENAWAEIGARVLAAAKQ
jgi:hypothetical protein